MQITIHGATRVVAHPVAGDSARWVEICALNAAGDNLGTITVFGVQAVENHGKQERAGMLADALLDAIAMMEVTRTSGQPASMESIDRARAALAKAGAP